jgi:hypothetical protein
MGPHLSPELVRGDGGCRGDGACAAELPAKTATGSAAGNVHAVVGQPERLRDRPLHVVRALGCCLHLPTACAHVSA